MQTTYSHNNWFENNNSVHRKTITFLFSAVIMLVLLMLPIHPYRGLIVPTHTIKLELFKPNLKEITKPIETKIKQVERVAQTNSQFKPEPKAKPKTESQAQVHQSVKAIKKKEQKPIVIVSTPKLQVKKSKEPNTKLPTSGMILNSTFGRDKLFELDSDFQVRTDKPNEFKFKTIQQPKWNHVTKLINEDLDKPQYEMNFYAEGIEGSVERFMDKITYKKRFTTRYGTKIDCAAVAYVLVVCGWK